MGNSQNMDMSQSSAYVTRHTIPDPPKDNVMAESNTVTVCSVIKEGNNAIATVGASL
ncbi:MAG: hypothetical protein LUD19_02775 [Clostridia bacterium]|nr:hypothetical protein [Clostridia bacterium]